MVSSNEKPSLAPLSASRGQRARHTPLDNITLATRSHLDQQLEDQPASMSLQFYLKNAR